MPPKSSPADDQILLTIIIVSFNTRSLTLQALDSAVQDCVRSTLLAKQAAIFVVDNNSSDESVRAVRAYARECSIPIEVIAQKQNLGFARANNVAIRKASNSRLLLLLNSDTYVQAGALEKLVSSFLEYEHDDREEPLGILAATLINEDGTLQPQGGHLPNLLSLACQMLLLDDIPLIGRFLPSIQHTGRRAHAGISPTSNSSQLVPSGWVGGTAMCLNSQMLEQIGLLDEDIFMYAEDIELCMRARHHHWQVALHPSSRITHFGQKSSSSANAIRGEIAGLLYIWSKHLPLWQAGTARFLIQLGTALRAFIFSLVGRSEKARIYSQLLAELTES